MSNDEYNESYEAGARSVQKQLDLVTQQRNQLAQIINGLALIPAPDFYKPLDHAADLVNKAWQEKNRILAAAVEGSTS